MRVHRPTNTSRGRKTRWRRPVRRCHRDDVRTIHDHRLDRIEGYYDVVPRASASAEPCGPFTIFVADAGTGWQFYARPERGGPGRFEAADVERVLERQQQLGVPRAIEWVEQMSPELLPAVLAAGHQPQRYPLLALTTLGEVEPDPRARTLHPAEPHLALAVGAVSAGFHGVDEVEPGDTGIRDDVAELMGIAVPPGHRRRGHGTAITRSLVTACRDRGVELVFLSAASDAAAEIYRRVGFVDVGTACILQVAD